MIPDDVQDAIAYVARETARKYPPCETDDLAQELGLWYLALPDQQAAVGVHLLKQHMFGMARDWALADRAAWHHASAQYYYTPQDVRMILENALSADPEDWQSGYVPQDARSELGSDALDVIADVTSAFRDIAPDDLQAIVVWQSSPNALSATERTAAARAIDRLTEQMNTKKSLRDKPTGEPAGTRRAISNATAREIARRQG